MAIFYSRVKTIGVRQGSIVSAAAYRSGEKLTSDKTGKTADFQRKQGVVYSEIIAPASAPDWTKNRSQLWNKVEATETHKKARYAKEIVVALPHELSPEQNIVLMQEYVKSNFTSMGMVVDFAIHIPDPAKASTGKYIADQRNIHCHILLTDRPLNGDEFAKGKNRDWDKVKHVNRWRKNWAGILNDAFEIEGLEQRFDHRSYEKQGVDMIPQRKEGKIATGMKRRKAKLDPEKHSEIIKKLEHNERAKEENQRLIVDAPEREERKKRKPKKGQNSTSPSIDLELSKRYGTPTTSGSNVDAVQNTAKLKASSTSSKSGSTPGHEPNFEGVKPTPTTRNEIVWNYVLAQADKRAKFKKRKEHYSDERTAVEIASKTRVHIGKKEKDISAVNAYRVALADITKDAKAKNIAYHYYKQTDSALECDRVIRDYLRRRGFSNREISKAMRRASPAMYRKSTAEARKYAKKFNAYARSKKWEESERLKKLKAIKNEVKKRAEDYNRRKGIIR